MTVKHPIHASELVIQGTWGRTTSTEKSTDATIHDVRTAKLKKLLSHQSKDRVNGRAGARGMVLPGVSGNVASRLPRKRKGKIQVGLHHCYSEV